MGLGDDDADQIEEDIALVSDWMEEAEELDAIRQDLSHAKRLVERRADRVGDWADNRVLHKERCSRFRHDFKKMRDVYSRIRKLQSHPRWHQAIKDALATDPEISRRVTDARNKIDHAHAVARVAGTEYEKNGCATTEAGPWLLPSSLLGRT